MGKIANALKKAKDNVRDIMIYVAKRVGEEQDPMNMSPEELARKKARERGV